MKNINILGISSFYHDAAAALLQNDELVAAAQEERFTRKKYDPAFPRNAIKWCLEYSGLTVNDLDFVVFYDKPYLKLERILETYYAFAPKGLRSFLSAIPIWMKEKLFIRKILVDELSKISNKLGEGDQENKYKLLFSNHHLSHAASAFYPSPFEEAAILTIDGVGEWATASIGYGQGKEIKTIKELNFPHSLGLLYSAFTYYTGFKVNSGEHKLMGLAPYGDPSSERTRRYTELIYDKLIDVKDDGSLWLNMNYFDYAAGLRMTRDEKWEELFGIKRRQPESIIRQEYPDMAYAIQRVTEDIILRMAKHAKELTDAKNLVMAGGVALNCVANGKLLRSGIFDDIWIQPAAGDAGGALGAAYAVRHLFMEEARETRNHDKMNGAFLGPDYCDNEIEQAVRSHKAKYRRFDNFDDLCEVVAREMAEGKVIGWFQGRMEWGPRALGNRSILADARTIETKEKVSKLKSREEFRPFAPSVLCEDLSKYFNLEKSSPYMLLTAEVVGQGLDIPSVTHIDYSARIQTVHHETNPRYYELIKRFRELTGCSAILNTSFNMKGEPIVCTPSDAYRCFMATDIDYLIMNNYLFDKRRQQGELHEVD